MSDRKSVFISYSSKDERTIQKMTAMLDHMGISYWIAPDMIPAGSNYAREIPGAIQQCEIFLLVLSGASQSSIWVEKEIDSAIYYRKTIVPFQIDEEPMSDMFRFYLNNVQTISCTGRPQEAIRELKQRLRVLLGMEQQSDYAGESTGGKKEIGKMEMRGAGKNVGHDAADTAGMQIGRGVSGEETSGAVKDRAGSDADRNTGEKTATEDRRDRSVEITRKKKELLLRTQGIPTECSACGGAVEMIAQGIYRCKRCGMENLDYFRKVQRFLQAHGAKPAVVIERETGVPRNVIEKFLAQEYLEIPKLEPIRLSCSRCGTPIRTGTMCELCKKSLRRTRTEPKAAWRSSRRRS